MWYLIDKDNVIRPSSPMAAAHADQQRDPRIGVTDIKITREYEMELVDGVHEVKETIEEMIRVSTVFLALDHNFNNKGPPVLFETCAFFDKLGQDLREELGLHSTSEVFDRYSSSQDAVRGHKGIVADFLTDLYSNNIDPSDIEIVHRYGPLASVETRFEHAAFEEWFSTISEEQK